MLVATEAVGMVHNYVFHLAALMSHACMQGADIPDIVLVVQFGAPPSLTTWVQRAGRAGRSPRMFANATLLVEKSAFEEIRRKVLKKPTKKSLRSSIGANGPVGGGPLTREYHKVIERALRLWLETPGCRWEAADDFFNNPLRLSGELTFYSLRIPGCLLVFRGDSSITKPLL